MSDEDHIPPAAGAAEPTRGIDLARAALTQARAQARTRYDHRQDQDRARRGLKRSGSGPDDRDPQPLRQIMGRLVSERGWQTPAAVHGVLQRWPEIVGPALAANCRPERFEDGELVVRAESDNYATQLRWLAPKLLARLNQELGDGTVTYIRVLGPAQERRRGAWRAQP
ncbi:DUF721 domain-containing protein [Embleya sp. NPDC056575]|uniref:DUF721 domain-containing protein n=1 Tax=unclassified Embleya TaxID=2699296 RepID=UPI0036C01B55